MEEVRKYYVYAWIDTTNNLPFYIGVGSHRSGIKIQTKYERAYHVHYTNGSRKKLAFCQRYANKLKLNNTPHIVKILHDNLTIEERINRERELIKLYGRRSENNGILCNITEGGETNPMHCPTIREKHSKIMKTIINIPTITEESKENHRLKTLANMQDPEYRAKWDRIVSSSTHIEKLRNANTRSKMITFNGVVYRSVAELSRYLKISKALLLYRIKHCIPLDAPPNKGNTFSKSKGPDKNKTIRKCVKCAMIKDLVDFCVYSRGNKTHHTKTCIQCDAVTNVVDS